MEKKKEELKSFHAIVQGRVQGVGFRYSTLAKARALGVNGFVKNKDDGTVEVVAEGDEKKCRSFLEWLKEGPSGAYVRNVEFYYTTYSGEYNSFVIDF
jgi:acylphosphatase